MTGERGWCHFGSHLALYTDGKHPIADNLIASIADTFFAGFGDCTTKDKTCTVYGQNFQAADMHQINAYWKRIGKLSFQERGWVVANTLTIFDRAYNKGQYGISAALYNLVTVEAMNEEAVTGRRSNAATQLMMRECA